MINFTKFLEAYHDNRSGFAKKRREDDEYHTPDPVTRTHKVSFDVSKEGGEKHNRTVTIQHSTKTPEEAKKAARAHLEKQGYKIHEEVINEGAYEKAEENKKSADAAKKQGDMFAHHLHMADHHDNMAEWHSSKGRHSEADRHAEKAEQHHEKAMALKESTELDEAARGIPHKVRYSYDDPSGSGIASGHITLHAPSKEHAARYATSDLTKKGKKNVKVHAVTPQKQRVAEESELDEANTTHQHHVVSKLDGNVLASYKTKEEAHKNAQGNKVVSGSLETIGDHQYVKEEVGGDEESNTIHEVRMTAAMKLQKAFQREQEKRESEKKAGEELLKKPVKEDTEKCAICNKSPCWCDDSHSFVEGKKPGNLNPGWMLKVDPELAKKVADNKKKFKSFKDTVGKKIETK